MNSVEGQDAIKPSKVDQTGDFTGSDHRRHDDPARLLHGHVDVP